MDSYYAIAVRRVVTRPHPVWLAAVLDRQDRRLYETGPHLSGAEAVRKAEAWAKSQQRSPPPPTLPTEVWCR
jgi:hypothetical protein